MHFIGRWLGLIFRKCGLEGDEEKGKDWFAMFIQIVNLKKGQIDNIS